MTRDTIIQAIAGGVVAASTAVSGVLAVGLTNSLSVHKLGYNNNLQESDPPEVALGIALGPMRGVFVNALWMRAESLKEEGKYYELIDLASSITRLQPRWPAAWTFHAWNLSYNVSVTTQTPEERWLWVSAGIDLLRQRGARFNPNSLLIHKELGWIFLHKVQGYTDDANSYYKRQLAVEWTEILGVPPATGSVTDFTVMLDTWKEWMGKVASAPDTFDTLLRELSEEDTRLRSEDPIAPRVRALIADLSAAGWSLDSGTLRRRQFHVSLGGSVQGRGAVSRLEGKDRALFDIANDKSRAEAWERLLPTLRKRVLIDEYNMDPVLMEWYTERFGPIDWRHPAAHALYWSTKGSEGALKKVTEGNRRDYDFLNTDRIAIQAIQELYRSGEVFFDYTGYVVNPRGTNQDYFPLPHPYFIHSYQDILEHYKDTIRSGIFENEGERLLYTVYNAGYENFIKDAIRYFYRRGDKARAEEYKNNMGSWGKLNWNDPTKVEHYAKPIDEFIIEELKDRMDSPSVASTETAAALHGAFVDGLIGGNTELFKSNVDYARIVHAYYFSKMGRDSTVDREADGPKAIYMPKDFDAYAGAIYSNLLLSLNLDSMIDLYQKTPDGIRGYAYSVLVERLKPAMDEAGTNLAVSFDEAFPKPANLEEVERKRAEAIQEFMNENNRGAAEQR